jgi:hypothetical protein
LDALEQQLDRQYMQGIDNGYGFDPRELENISKKKES